ncbi:hypothetical protein DRN67_04380 [Candidatus Micrarchaeota archaeon]|nr:MAG: hypothetical protein DRN67_04380 [Candidatus Micrarchaeota archaeon]
MKTETKLPFKSTSKPSIKDIIIQTLSEEWPLTAKQIYSKIRRKTPTSITYQGVHKAVKQLEESGVLKVEENKYKVDLDWLKSIRSFSELVHRKYAHKVSPDSSPDRMSFVFDTVAEAEDFLIDLALQFEPKPDSKLYLCWVHFWIPLFLNRKTYKKMLELLQRIPSYGVTPSDTPIDRWCSDYWSSHGLTNKKLGVDIKTDCSFLVLDDMVIQIYYPHEIIREVDLSFSKAKTIQELDPDRFFERVFEKKTKIPIVVSKNPALAEHLKDKILASFNSPLSKRPS